jgi:host factor-I protein
MPDETPVAPPKPAVPPTPRSNTHQEVDYLRRLIDSAVQVTIKIKGGEEVSGVIEYYDTTFIRLTRQGQPNLFIFKKDIMYLTEHEVA